MFSPPLALKTEHPPRLKGSSSSPHPWHQARYAPGTSASTQRPQPAALPRTWHIASSGLRGLERRLGPNYGRDKGP